MTIVEPEYEWLGNGSFSFPVVGESFYQDNIRAATGRYDETEGAEIEVGAMLIPEPNNPHDKNAIMVAIGGKVVGYLPRRNTTDYHSALTQQGFGQQPIGVEALIEGGWVEADGTRAMLGVKLDLSWPPEPMFPGPAKLDHLERTETRRAKTKPTRPRDEAPDIQQQMLIETRIGNERKSILVAYLLWLFLGMIAAHRFYLGKGLSAVLMILMALFGLVMITQSSGNGSSAILLIVWGLWLLADALFIPGMAESHTRRLRRKYNRKYR